MVTWTSSTKSTRTGAKGHRNPEIFYLKFVNPQIQVRIPVTFDVTMNNNEFCTILNKPFLSPV